MTLDPGHETVGGAIVKLPITESWPIAIFGMAATTKIPIDFVMRMKNPLLLLPTVFPAMLYPKSALW